MENKPLRNFGMITERDYFGKSLVDATEVAENNGFKVRITEKDGESFIFTMEARADRINFRVLNDRVIGVYGG